MRLKRNKAPHYDGLIKLVYCANDIHKFMCNKEHNLRHRVLICLYYGNVPRDHSLKNTQLYNQKLNEDDDFKHFPVSKMIWITLVKNNQSMYKCTKNIYMIQHWFNVVEKTFAAHNNP